MAVYCLLDESGRYWWRYEGGFIPVSEQVPLTLLTRDEALALCQHLYARFGYRCVPTLIRHSGEINPKTKR